MVKIATPISHLFDNPRHAQQIMEKSDCLECRDRSLNVTLPGQEVFHCHIQPIHKLGKDDFLYLEKICKLKPDLKLISFHAATSCNKFYVKGYMAQPEGLQYSSKEMLQNARENISQIKSIFGPHVSIAVENNNYYPTKAYHRVTDADFIREIVYGNDLFLLFDMAHAGVTAHNRKLDYTDYKGSLPLERMIQIHICRHSINEDSVAYDEHHLPGKAELEELKGLISLYRGVKYLTIEYYKDAYKLIKSLTKIREIINELS